MKKLLKLWISIPRFLRIGVLGFLTISVLLFALYRGLQSAFDLFSGISKLQLIFAAAAAMIIFLALRQKPK